MVVFGFCFIYPDIRLAELNEKVISIKKDSTIFQYESDNLEEEQNETLEKLEKIKKELNLHKHVLKVYFKKSLDVKDTARVIQELNNRNKNFKLLKSKNEREYFEFINKHKTEIFPLFKEVSELSKLSDDKVKIAEQIDINDIKLYYTHLELVEEENRFKRINLYSIIGQVIGIIMSLLGFIFWYLLHQKIQDKIIKYQLEEYNQKFKKAESNIIIKQ